MNKNETDCPNCLGEGIEMKSNENEKGFKYEKCCLCRGNKKVSREVEEDFILSLDENLINLYE